MAFRARVFVLVSTIVQRLHKPLTEATALFLIEIKWRKHSKALHFVIDLASFSVKRGKITTKTL
jgi:hypothetical protein